MSKMFDHVIIIMFENEYRSYVIHSPYMRWLAKQGIDLANFNGVMHPSQPNYVASVAGQLCGVVSDGNPLEQTNPPAVPTAPCLADLMSPKGEPVKVTWKVYMEDYPGNLDWVDGPPYATKHCPFFLFDSVRNDPERAKRIVSLDELWTDLENGTLPQYCWVVPNEWNDGHFTTGTEQCPNVRYPLVNQIAAWLEHDMLGRKGDEGLDLFGDPRIPERTLVVVTFDESDYESQPDGTGYDGPNQIYTVLLGNLAAIVPGTVLGEGFNHYSLLRTVEENFELGTLGTNDAAANWFRFLAEEGFEWSAALPLAPATKTPKGCFEPISTTEGIVLGTLGDHAYLISQGDGRDYTPTWASFDGQQWTDPARISSLDQLSGPMAVAGDGEELVLAYFALNGDLMMVSFAPAGGWTAPTKIPTSSGPRRYEVVAPLALASFSQDGERQLMLVFAATNGLASMIRSRGEWSIPTQILPNRTGWIMAGSALALTEAGNVMLLVYQGDDRRLRGLSYSLAAYNTMRVGDDGQIVFPAKPGIWAAEPAHLIAYPDASGGNIVEWGTSGSLALTYLEGNSFLAWSVPQPPVEFSDRGQYLFSDWVAWSSFSLAGVLTSEQSGTPEASYGTLAQASWSRPEPLACAPLRRGFGNRGIAMTTLGDQVLMVFGPADAVVVPWEPLNYLYATIGSFVNKPERIGFRRGTWPDA